MKKALVFVFCVMLLPKVALAADYGVYVEPRFTYGYTVMDTMKGGGVKSDDGDSVFGGGLAVGYDFATRFDLPVRGELEFSYFSEAEGSFSKRVHKVKQQFDIMTLFANAYFDFENRTKFTPYVGAGIGFAFIDSEGKIDGQKMGSKDTTNFAANIGLGVAYEVIDNIDVTLGYRFAYLGDAKTKSRGGLQAKSEDIYMHQVNLGLRYTF